MANTMADTMNIKRSTQTMLLAFATINAALWTTASQASSVNCPATQGSLLPGAAQVQCATGAAETSEEALVSAPELPKVTGLDMPADSWLQRAVGTRASSYLSRLEAKQVTTDCAGQKLDRYATILADQLALDESRTLRLRNAVNTSADPAVRC